jgi:nucleoside-diphosphate-sugar epimerase
MSRVMVIGGPGNISTASIHDLLERGETVGVFSRAAGLAKKAVDPRIQQMPGDRDDLHALQEAVEMFHPDIVIDFVCYQPTQAQAAAQILKGKLAQFIFVSTVDVYGYPLARLPQREDDAWNAPNCEYASNKRTCEEIFQNTPQLPLTIVRPAYSFGPPFVLTFNSRSEGRYMVTRLRNKVPVLVPGDGTTLMHVSSAWNTGRMIARVVGERAALGCDYTVGHPTFITQNDYVQLFAQAVGEKPVMVHIPSELILSCPGTEDSLLHVLTRFNVAFSTERFADHYPDFQWDCSLEQAANAYVAFHDRAGSIPSPDETILDDQIIQAWNESTGDFRQKVERLQT